MKTIVLSLSLGLAVLFTGGESFACDQWEVNQFYVKTTELINSGKKGSVVMIAYGARPRPIDERINTENDERNVSVLLVRLLNGESVMVGDKRMNSLRCEFNLSRVEDRDFLINHFLTSGLPYKLYPEAITRPMLCKPTLGDLDWCSEEVKLHKHFREALQDWHGNQKRKEKNRKRPRAEVIDI